MLNSSWDFRDHYYWSLQPPGAVTQITHTCAWFPVIHCLYKVQIFYQGETLNNKSKLIQSYVLSTIYKHEYTLALSFHLYWQCHVAHYYNMGCDNLSEWWLKSWRSSKIADTQSNRTTETIPVCSVSPLNQFPRGHYRATEYYFGYLNTCSNVGQLPVCFLYHFHGRIPPLKHNPSSSSILALKSLSKFLLDLIGEQTATIN